MQAPTKKLQLTLPETELLISICRNAFPTPDMEQPVADLLTKLKASLPSGHCMKR